MNRKNIILVVLVAGGIWYFSKQAVRIDVGSPAISFLKLAGSGIEFNVKLPVLNRSDFTYTIQGFLGQLLFNGSAIGTIQLKEQIQLPAHGTAAPEFVSEVGYTSLIGPLSALVQKTLGFSIPGMTPDPNTPAPSLASLRVKGTLYVSGLAVDIDEPLG